MSKNKYTESDALAALAALLVMTVLVGIVAVVFAESLDRTAAIQEAKVASHLKGTVLK